MCTDEIWTYPECGCSIHHQIPCHEVDDHSPTCSPSRLHVASPKLSKSKSTRSNVNFTNTAREHPSATSPTIDPSSPSPTPPTSSSDSDSHPDDYYHAYLNPTNSLRLRNPDDINSKGRVPSYRRQHHGFDVPTIPTPPPIKPHPPTTSSATTECPSTQTVKKSFLEPICDECLLDELGVYVQDASGGLSVNDQQCSANEDKKETDTVAAEAKQPTEERGRTHVRNGSGLIWSSDVQIEITPSPTSSPKAAGFIFDDEKEVVDFAQSDAVPTAQSRINEASTPIHNAGMFSTAASTPRNAPATYSPGHVPSSIDLARRRPWLVKQYGDYLQKKKEAAENQFDNQSGTLTGTTCFTDVTAKQNETDNKILESTVKVEVLDDSALNDALHSDLPPLPTSPMSPRYRFPSTHFPHAVPPRHPSTFSHTTSQSIDADADDEASLPTFSPVASPIPTISLPIPTFTSQSPLLSPNITQRKPRPRSATKALRRRGMDISRSNFALRISSRWGSAEKRCLKGFREDLLGRSENDEGKDRC